MTLKNCISLMFVTLFLVSCASDNEVVVLKGKRNLQQATSVLKKKYIEEGHASWYGSRFHGLKTAGGQKYDMYEYTAAHPSLPLPSVVKVVNLENKKSVMVVVNDRGPYYDGENKRIIDMSKKAAKDLGFLKKGVAKVSVEYLPNETRRLKSQLKPNQYPRAISKYKHLIIKDATTVASAEIQS